MMTSILWNWFYDKINKIEDKDKKSIKDRITFSLIFMLGGFIDYLVFIGTIICMISWINILFKIIKKQK